MGTRKRAKKWARALERVRAHVDAGGRLFVPGWRMRQGRWEASVEHARAKREGRTATMTFRSCDCGSIHCLAVPCPIYEEK